MVNQSAGVVFRSALAALIGCLACGCGPWHKGSQDNAAPVEKQAIPAPVNLMLPKTIRIHPFTGTRTFDDSGGVRGIEMRIEALDSYGDSTKAFGVFRFELYQFLPNSPDPKGKRLAVWEENLLEPKANVLHWDKITRAYMFKLEWSQPIPVGQKFVLLAVFSSPYTERLFAQRVFVSGQ